MAASGATIDALTYTTQGTRTITWTFNEGNGNVVMVDQMVIVDDVSGPATPILANVTNHLRSNHHGVVIRANFNGEEPD